MAKQNIARVGVKQNFAPLTQSQINHCKILTRFDQSATSSRPSESRGRANDYIWLNFDGRVTGCQQNPCCQNEYFCVSSLIQVRA